MVLYALSARGFTLKFMRSQRDGRSFVLAEVILIVIIPL